MIFQSLMGLGKLRCDVPNGTTQGQDCPWMKQNKKKLIEINKVLNPFLNFNNVWKLCHLTFCIDFWQKDRYCKQYCATCNILNFGWL
jgi:hypothetical protein